MTRPVQIRAWRESDLVVDLFAGGGGASEGIRAALGRDPDIAINHSPEAIAVHRANHPGTRHYVENVWQVSPVAACAGRPVSLLWLSPDCTHFSRAKGTKPVKKGIRGLAWAAIRWAREAQPATIVLENVGEFQTWGPLGDDDRPDPARAGTTFRRWLADLRRLGYAIEFRELTAADYGAPTTRRRFFLVARRDGAPIAWPEPTHGAFRGSAHRTAAEVMDWTKPGVSIFGRTRELAPATLARIATGIRRFVTDAPRPRPFIVRHGHYSTITGAGMRAGCGAGIFRGQPIDQPLATVCATNDKHLVIPIITKHYGGVVGHGVDRPLGTITAKDHHALTMAMLSRDPRDADRSALVRSFLEEYGGESEMRGLLAREPGTVSIAGETYSIVDITTRMLIPRELFNAQGFRPDYVIDPEHEGKRIGSTAQTRLAGNSVPPPVAEAILRANLLERVEAAA